MFLQWAGGSFAFPILSRPGIQNCQTTDVLSSFGILAECRPEPVSCGRDLVAGVGSSTMPLHFGSLP